MQNYVKNWKFGLAMIFNQVTKLIAKHHVVGHNIFRCNNTLVNRNYTVLVPLASRRLVKVSGSDASTFLQGLMTNDMRHFEDGAKSIYAMFLNNKGRVLFDTLIHKWDGEDSYLIECHKDVLTQLQNNLKVYKLKRSVKFEDVNKDFKMWALLSTENFQPDVKFDPKSDVNVIKDPRLPELGCRILSAPYFQGEQLANVLGKDINIGDDEEVYTYLRYKLGVSEGPLDLPPGVCFPLEVNCDYLHGVSFHKGCYIGQELTARVYHTGVVRKRIMPLVFTEAPKTPIPIDTLITAKDPSQRIPERLGKLKGYIHNHAIGLVRIREALEVNMLKIGEHTAQILKPSWWPVEAPKEKAKESTATKPDLTT